MKKMATKARNEAACLSCQERDSYVDMWKQTSAELTHLKSSEEVSPGSLWPAVVSGVTVDLQRKRNELLKCRKELATAQVQPSIPLSVLIPVLHLSVLLPASCLVHTTGSRRATNCLPVSRQSMLAFFTRLTPKVVQVESMSETELWFM